MNFKFYEDECLREFLRFRMGLGGFCDRDECRSAVSFIRVIINGQGSFYGMSAAFSGETHKKREYTKLFWRTCPLVSSDSVLITRNVKCTCSRSKFSATSPRCTLVKGNSPQHQFHYCCTKGCFYLFPSLPRKLLCSCPAFRIIICIQFRLGYQIRAFLVMARRFDGWS
jgi:hypothetical protein